MEVACFSEPRQINIRATSSAEICDSMAEKICRKHSFVIRLFATGEAIDEIMPGI